MWTIGGSVDEAGRKLFDSYFKKMLREPLKSESKADKTIKFEKGSQIPELSNTQCYDFYYEFKEARWRNWKDLLGW
jgi:dynein heavy chain